MASVKNPTFSPSFEAENRTVLVTRIRLTAFLAVLVLAVAIPADMAVFTDHVPARVRALLNIGVVCVVGALATLWTRLHAFAAPLAVAMMFGLAYNLSCLLALSPQDVDILVGPVAVTMIATAFVFPWGMWVQIPVSAVLAFVYGCQLSPGVAAAPTRLFNIAITLGDGVVLSIVGAWLLDRQRREVFVQREEARTLARQQGLLLDASRALNATHDLPTLQRHIARLGLDLVGGDAAYVTIRDRHRRTWRIEAMAGEVSSTTETLAACEFDDGAMSEVLAALDDHRVKAVPGYPALDHLLPHLEARLGMRQVLYAAVHHDDQILAILNFGLRSAAGGFTCAQRDLAAGFAHHVGTALRNAWLIEDLQAASALKTQFVSTMSHELRTPLLVVMGYAEMLALSDGDRATAIDRIQSASRDLLGLIESTLDVARLEAGLHGAILQPLPLRTLWNELQAACADLPRDPSVDVQWHNPLDITLTTDRRKLTMVVKHLVGNACKFTPRGNIDISTGIEAGGAVIRVRDTGVGIPVTALPHVFEMFRQGDSADTRSYGGVGLGLYLVRRLLDELGGEIEVESTEGRGSTFTVRVPVAGATTTGTTPS
jgi:signal transduction histidine kinase